MREKYEDGCGAGFLLYSAGESDSLKYLSLENLMGFNSCEGLVMF